MNSVKISTKEGEKPEQGDTVESLEQDLNILKHRRRLLLDTREFEVWNDEIKAYQIVTMHLATNPDRAELESLDEFELHLEARLRILQVVEKVEPDRAITERPPAPRSDEDDTLEFEIGKD